MKTEEFLQSVKDRGGLVDQDQAGHVAHTVLAVLAQRKPSGDTNALAAQLPQGIKESLAAQGETESFDAEQFAERVAAQLGSTVEQAELSAAAVLSTAADAVSEGEKTKLLTQFPSGFTRFFTFR